MARCRQQNPNPTRPSILLSRHGHPILIRSTPPSASGPRDRDTNLRVGGTLDSRFCIGVSLSARFSAPPLLLLSLGPRVLLVCDLARRINGTLCSHNKHYALLPLRNNSKKKNFHSETTAKKKLPLRNCYRQLELIIKAATLRPLCLWAVAVRRHPTAATEATRGQAPPRGHGSCYLPPVSAPRLPLHPPRLDDLCRWVTRSVAPCALLHTVSGGFLTNAR
jgi:hypothetical protein